MIHRALWGAAPDPMLRSAWVDWSCWWSIFARRLPAWVVLAYYPNAR